MGNFLRLANPEETRRFYYKDTDEYIEVKAEMTKRQANGLMRFAPRKEDDIDGGLRFTMKAFTDLVVGWSLTDEEGNMIPVSVEVYEQLDASAGRWIDQSLGELLREIFEVEGNAAEGKLDDLPPTQSKELDMSSSA